MASRTAAAVGAASALVTLVAGCATAEPGTPNRYAAPPAPVCTADTLPTRVPGRWTIGTRARTQAPWFLGDRPENGQGFESAVGYAVAGRLGYDATRVTWVRIDRADALAAGPKPFDVGIDLFAQTPERRRLVDMSSWYYLDRQAVVTLRTSTFARADTIAELTDARLGAAAGSTGLTAAGLIGASKPAQVYDELDVVKRALWRRQIDVLIVDVPTAFALARAQPDGLIVVGQLPRAGVPEQFGLVLEKESRLTPCVKKAVDDLRTDGTLLELEKQWLVQATGVPELS